MDNFEPIEEHRDFEPMNGFEPQQNFSFEQFSRNNNNNLEPQQSFNGDFEPQQSYGNDFESQQSYDNNFESNFQSQQNFNNDQQHDFEPRQSYDNDFEPQQKFESKQKVNKNFENKQNVHNFKSQTQKAINKPKIEEEIEEDDEEIKSFKKNIKIAGIVVILVLVSFFAIAFLGASRKSDYTDVIMERKVSTHKIEELRIIPNKSIFKPGERFKFDISRDVFFKGDLKEVLLSFKIPENIPYRQEIDQLVIVPTPEKIEQRDDGKYAVVRLQNPKGSLQLHIAGFAKVHTYTPDIAQRLGKNIDGELTPEEQERYTSPEPNIESNDKFIKTTSAKFIPKATNDLDTVKNIYDYVVTNLEYKDSEIGKNKGAIAALHSKKGVCMEFADLMTAFCRTKGIPARVVYGFDIPFIDMERLSNFGHAWVEAYIPEYGWVTFDPTNKMSKRILNQALALDIKPYEILTYAFKNRNYLTVDTNEIHMNYKGSGDVECQNLHIKLTKR